MAQVPQIVQVLCTRGCGLVLEKCPESKYEDWHRFSVWLGRNLHGYPGVPRLIKSDAIDGTEEIDSMGGTSELDHDRFFDEFVGSADSGDISVPKLGQRGVERLRVGLGLS